MTLTLVATPDPEFNPRRQPEMFKPRLTVEQARQTLTMYLDSLFDQFGDKLDCIILKEHVAVVYPREVSLLQEEGLWT